MLAFNIIFEDGTWHISHTLKLEEKEGSTTVFYDDGAVDYMYINRVEIITIQH